ncbi:MAG: hypothetical protein APF77_20600 [Clostridia bacterium BRH_c25]|nr:MAG: hypothetical protein APF77_20600 [Clostridia bacterium BRH_c25]
MIRNFRSIENSYIENFAEMEDRGDHIIFWDEKLPDMYAFNCILVKENINMATIESFVADRLDQAISNRQDFLNIIIHPELEITEILKERFIGMGFKIQTNLYMKLSDNKLGSIKGNKNCVVVRAGSEKEYEDGQRLDIKTSINADMPAEFAMEKSLRKKEVFQQKNSRLLSYLCYYQDISIGKCELYMKDEYAKIEDFDVLDNYQRKGFGTAMLEKMISDALESGKKYIYLITGKADTPREMYEKTGFEIIGEEVELFCSKK